MVIYYDNEGKFEGTGMTVEQLMTYEDAYVFSTVNGDVTLSTEGANRTVISAVYNSGLYTYQMEETAYVVFYVRVGDNIYCGPIKERSIKAAIDSRLPNAGEVEADCLQDMIDLYDTVRAYRGK